MTLPARYTQFATALLPSVLMARRSSPQRPRRSRRSRPPPQEKQREGRPLDKMPQTADEKAKVLNDLYAHLATANDEQSAKSISETIERLWLQSGSETINLLMERSAELPSPPRMQTSPCGLLDYVVELAPDYAEGFNRRAYVHFSQNNLESAVGDLRRTLALEPNHFKALDGLGQIWREHGNKKGALRVIKQLLEIHPNWPGAKQAAEELTREVEGQGI